MTTWEAAGYVGMILGAIVGFSTGLYFIFPRKRHDR